MTQLDIVKVLLPPPQLELLLLPVLTLILDSFWHRRAHPAWLWRGTARRAQNGSWRSARGFHSAWCCASVLSQSASCGLAAVEKGENTHNISKIGEAITINQLYTPWVCAWHAADGAPWPRRAAHAHSGCPPVRAWNSRSTVASGCDRSSWWWPCGNNGHRSRPQCRYTSQWAAPGPAGLAQSCADPQPEDSHRLYCASSRSPSQSSCPSAWQQWRQWPPVRWSYWHRANCTFAINKINS